MKVNEIFVSIQGEGKYIGKPQVFVRLQGCNLECSWCDTRYAREGEGTEMDVSEILKKLKKSGLKSVCITGGEPMMQRAELKHLVKKLKKEKYEIVMETNGTLYDKEIFDTVDCVSFDVKPPSSGEESDSNLLKKLKKKDQVKVIIAGENDYHFAKKLLPKIKPDVDVIFQPLGGTNLKWLSEKIMADKLRVRILPQLHKLAGLK